MATWRIEIEHRHTVTREKFFEADSEDAARALAQTEVGAQDRRTWDEIWAYTASEISDVLEIDERGCPCCGSSDLTGARSCAGCAQPWPTTPEEWQVAYEGWLASHRAAYPHCTCDDCIAAQAARLPTCATCGARGVTIFERARSGTSGVFYCGADEAHFSLVPVPPQPPTPHWEGWTDREGYWVQLLEGEHTRDVYGPYPDVRTAIAHVIAVDQD